MPVHFKLYIVILCCIIPVTSIYAQQDTITKTQKGFNALNYSLQKRDRSLRTIISPIICISAFGEASTR